MRRKIWQGLMITVLSISVLAWAAFLTLGLTYSEIRTETTVEIPPEPYAQAYNQNNLIRFHVIANSDREDDQDLKRRVRDVIVQRMAPEFSKAATVSEARVIAAGHLEDIKTAAEKEVAGWGKKYQVAVELGNFDFPVKSYGALTLPAGNYEAVRVILGQGQGANWWCVLFPPLCFVDLSENVQQVSAPAAVENANKRRVEVRFKMLELLGIKNYY